MTKALCHWNIFAHVCMRVCVLCRPSVLDFRHTHCRYYRNCPCVVYKWVISAAMRHSSTGSHGWQHNKSRILAWRCYNIYDDFISVHTPKHPSGRGQWFCLLEILTCVLNPRILQSPRYIPKHHSGNGQLICLHRYCECEFAHTHTLTYAEISRNEHSLIAEWC